MSQSSIKRSAVESLDWMRDLEMDALKLQSLVGRLDELAERALRSMGNKDLEAAGIRLLEIREGLRLLCDLCGVKLVRSS